MPKTVRTDPRSPRSGSLTSQTERSSTKCTPRVQVPFVAQPASAVSHGSREIAMYVVPSSHRADGLSAK